MVAVVPQWAALLALVSWAGAQAGLGSSWALGLTVNL